MSGNSSASGNDYDENEPILTEQQSIDKYNRTVAAYNPLSTEKQLKQSYALKSLEYPFGSPGVIPSRAGGGGAMYDADGNRVIRSARYYNTADDSNRASAAALQRIYYPAPAPAPAPAPTSAPQPVTAPVTTAAVATEPLSLPTEVPSLRNRRKRETSEERKTNGESVPKPNLEKSICEKLGNCSIQGGSRKRSKKSKASKKSRKVRKTIRRVKKSRRSASRKVKRHQ